MSTVQESAAAAAAAQLPAPPPIVEIFWFANKLLASAFAFLWTRTSYASAALRLASSPFTALVSALYKPISYLFAPFVLAINVVFDVFVLTPYSVLQRLISDFYPIYAFIVVSCICAIFIGISARGVSYVLRSAFRPSSYYAPHSVAPVSHKSTKGSKPSVGKKVAIKEEHAYN